MRAEAWKATVMTTTGHPASEIVQRGQERYNREIRDQVEGQFAGQMLALDVDTGKYALADDSLTALDRLKALGADPTIYLVRVGSATAISIGVGRRASQP